MKSKKIILLVLIVIAICIAGIYLYENYKPLTMNDYFDLNEQYNASWNESTNEFSVQKVFPLKFNESYENVTTKVDFYKESELIKSVESTNSTENGKLVVYTSVKLNQKPDDIKFNILEGDLTETDMEAIKFAEKRNWILNLL